MSDETPADREDILRQLDAFDVALSDRVAWRIETLFPRLEGWGARGEIKRKAKLIRNVEPRLVAILNEGEEVLFVSRGVQSSFSESYFLGAWANYINQTVFVLTTLRLIMFHSTSKGVPKAPNWMVFYSEITDFQSSWTGMVTLRLQDGRRYRYGGFPRADRKAMPLLFEETLATYRALGFTPESTQSRENLCNECFQVVPKAHLECAACGSTFWAPTELAVRSLMFPSWGDFLMGHTRLAWFELFGWMVTVGVAVSLVVSVNGPRAPAIAIGLMIIVVSHASDAWITYSIARKGLHTKVRGGSNSPVSALE